MALKAPSDEVVLLVGNRSGENISGLSVSFDILISGFADRNLHYQVVDKSAVGTSGKSGSFHHSRALNTAVVLLQFWVRLFFVTRVYLTVASSVLGFLRDALMIWSSRLLGRTVILHLHGGGYRGFYEAQSKWMKSAIRRTLSQADTIVVEGELLRDQFYFVSDAAGKVCVVPNCLPIGLRPDSSAVKSLPQDGPVKLLYLSNMIESKGYLKTLEACRILKQEAGTDIRCDFCGDFLRTAVNESDLSSDEAKAFFCDLIDSWGLEDVVAYHGVVRGKQKQEFLKNAHVFILPTRYPWEGQPVSIIEALAFGTPVISTRFRGIPELVIDGYNGFFTEPDAPEQIASHVRSLVRDPGMYRTFSENAIAHYHKNFTQEQHLKRLIPVILGR